MCEPATSQASAAARSHTPLPRRPPHDVPARAPRDWAAPAGKAVRRVRRVATVPRAGALPPAASDCAAHVPLVTRPSAIGQRDVIASETSVNLRHVVLPCVNLRVTHGTRPHRLALCLSTLVALRRVPPIAAACNPRRNPRYSPMPGGRYARLPYVGENMRALTHSSRAWSPATKSEPTK